MFENRKQELLYERHLLLDEAKICLAIHMPDGSTELIINQSAKAKLEYIDQAYDDDLHLKTNDAISIVGYMIYT